ncbi:hypothetical protein Tco_0026630 [Tanacetum coccineum]
MPKTIGEAFSLAHIVDARFEEERSTIAIAKPNEFTARVHIQDLEQTTQGRGDEPNRILLVTIHHKIYPITIEFCIKYSLLLGMSRKSSSFRNQLKNCFSVLNAEEDDNTKPPLSADTFGNNGGDESETSGPETLEKEVVDNGNGSTLIFLVGYGTGSKVVTGLPEEFQEEI